MRAKRRAVVLGIAGAVAAALGAGVAWSVASREPEPRDAKDLARVARTLASLARETALLAEGVNGRRVTAHYADAQRKALADAVEEQGEALDAPVAASVAAAAAKLRGLAADLHALLARMQRELVPSDSLRELGAEARRVAESVAALEPRS